MDARAGTACAGIAMGSAFDACAGITGTACAGSVMGAAFDACAGTAWAGIAMGAAT